MGTMASKASGSGNATATEGAWKCSSGTTMNSCTSKPWSANASPTGPVGDM